MMNTPTTDREESRSHKAGNILSRERFAERQDSGDVAVTSDFRKILSSPLQDPAIAGYYNTSVPVSQLDEPEIQSTVIRGIVQNRLNKIHTIANLEVDTGHNYSAAHVGLKSPVAGHPS